MKRLLPRCRRRASAATLLVVSAVILWAHPARAYLPESPQVQATVAKAVKFLESQGGKDNRMGAHALVGLALYKAHCGPNHPGVVRAVESIRKALPECDPKKVKLPESEIYEAGLATIFLATLDPVTYAPEIKCLLEFLQMRQKAHGGWGYAALKTGDTSMTQYGVLSAWEAGEVGFNVPVESIEKVAAWLIKTQDPSGGHAYQGKISGSFVPIKQGQLTLSMTAAGVGSLYICADMLGITTQQERPDNALPSALKEVKKETPKKEVKTQIPAAMFEAAQGRGMGWLQRNYKINPDGYTHYYMYALERCMSFRELAENGGTWRKAKDGPKWYNDGVAFLMKTQAKDGSWRSDCGNVPDTAFGILFLLRSTQKSIQRNRQLGGGTLVGGRGLPKNLDEAMIRGGEVVAKPLLGPAEQLMAVLEGAGDSAEEADYEQAIDLLAELPSQEAAKVVGKHADQLRKLVGDWAPEARLTAVRALAKTRDLDNAPTLIYALTDPNLEVARSARDALRRLARRPSGFGMPDEPTDGERLAAIRKWKAWYLAVRPDAKFRPIKFGE